MKIVMCKHCKNQIEYIKDSGVKVFCCGEEMTELVANTVDASKEKHVPVVEINNTEVVVSVGAVLHPMQEVHHIAYIILETNLGIQRKYLEVDKEPIAKFNTLVDEKIIAVYEYCNLHGLWKIDLM